MSKTAQPASRADKTAAPAVKPKAAAKKKKKPVAPKKPEKKVIATPPDPAQDETRGVGRPSLYKPEYIQKLLDFFNVPAIVTTEKKIVNAKGQEETITITDANDLPTLAEFCCEIGVHRETLLNWGKEHPEFFDAIKLAKEHQERILVKNGLAGRYEKTVTIFALKNLAGWRDKIEQTIETTDKTATTEQLDKIYRDAMEAAERGRQEVMQRANGGNGE